MMWPDMAATLSGKQWQLLRNNCVDACFALVQGGERVTNTFKEGGL